MTQRCIICGEDSVTTKHVSYVYHTGSVMHIPDTIPMHYKDCSVCRSSYGDMEIGKLNMQCMAVYRERSLSVWVDVKVEHMGKQQELHINTPYTTNHSVSVKLDNALADGSIPNEGTPLWEITISDEKNLNKVAKFKLYNPSVIGIVGFLRSLTDQQCSDFLKKK